MRLKMAHRSQTEVLPAQRYRGLACLHLLTLIGLLAGLAWPVPLLAAGRPAPEIRPAAALPYGQQPQAPAVQTPVARQLLQATVTPTPLPTDLPGLQSALDAAWNAQDWETALAVIAEIKRLFPTHDISEREYYAWVNYGYELLTQNQCTESKAAFVKALELRPEGEEAEMGLDLVSRYCATPVPPTVNPSATVQTTTTVPTSTPAPGVTPTCQPLATPLEYVVQPGDTMYSLARRYCTTEQAIMRANGRGTYYLLAGETIWIVPEDAETPGLIVHIVQPGETLFSIAQLYKTTILAIMTANGLYSQRIYAYQALYIPSMLQPGPIITFHIVQPGETLYTIAEQHETTVALLMMANGLHDYGIYEGQALLVPPEGWTGGPLGWPGYPPSGPDYPGGPVYQPGRTYVVRPGDTLFGLARRFGTSIAAIKSANHLTSNTIYAGTTLIIP